MPGITKGGGDSQMMVGARYTRAISEYLVPANSTRTLCRAPTEEQGISGVQSMPAKKE